MAWMIWAAVSSKNESTEKNERNERNELIEINEFGKLRDGFEDSNRVTNEISGTSALIETNSFRSVSGTNDGF